MNFWEALKGLNEEPKLTTWEEGARFALPFWDNEEYIMKQHNIVTKFPENKNYVPSVTELNSDEWRPY